MNSNLVQHLAPYLRFFAPWRLCVQSSTCQKLSVSLCLCVLFLTQLQSQPHNGEVYRQLLSDYFSQHTSPIQQINGPIFEGYAPAVKMDAHANRRLTVGFPEIVYQGLGKEKTMRRITLNLQIEDSTLQSEILSYQDTLTTQGLKEVYRKSPKALRGENPTKGFRWGMPILLIGGSVGGIVSLFYFRSRG